MEKQKLLHEHRELVNVLLEKTMYIYSEEFYELDEFERQKFIKDKMATEGHLNTLSNLLWSKVPQLGGFSDMFALGVLSSMFGNGCGGSTPTPLDIPKQEKDKTDVTEIQK